MSQRPINLSSDLKKLRDEGYNIEVKAGYLIVNDVPYVNSKKELKTGVLVSTLSLADDKTLKPDTHVMQFAGDHPCDQNGAPLARMVIGCDRTELLKDVWIDYTFSVKPLSGAYEDYYAKVTQHVAMLSGPAQAIDSTVTAKTFPVILTIEEESVFRYEDTASSRAEIAAACEKLTIGRIAILGLGGTGSYVLDLVAKTLVKEIHLYDGDLFLQHNAFRSPGAPSGEELGEKLQKTDYFGRLYSKMRRGIVSHAVHINESNVDELRQVDFVFICIDGGSAKRLVVTKLEEFGVSFVDVGMGLYLTSANSLGGVLRVTTSTPTQRDHVAAKQRIAFSDGDGNNEYDKNIQIADLNALNAALAVVKWKKLFGFYLDIDKEHHTTYTVDGNCLINEDLA
jgi:tRNA A37 threonylcarbamoyladenosine dehydratase